MRHREEYENSNGPGSMPTYQGPSSAGPGAARQLVEIGAASMVNDEQRGLEEMNVIDNDFCAGQWSIDDVVKPALMKRIPWDYLPEEVVMALEDDEPLGEDDEDFIYGKIMHAKKTHAEASLSSDDSYNLRSKPAPQYTGSTLAKTPRKPTKPVVESPPQFAFAKPADALKPPRRQKRAPRGSLP